jgi:hypothetical protein
MVLYEQQLLSNLHARDIKIQNSKQLLQRQLVASGKAENFTSVIDANMFGILGMEQMPFFLVALIKVVLTC